MDSIATREKRDKENVPPPITNKKDPPPANAQPVKQKGDPKTRLKRKPLADITNAH